MTNEQIIFNAEQALAKAGKIAYTGRTFEAVDDAGQKITVQETEEIHTFAVWKEYGFAVQKGQKAVAKVMIWKHTGSKIEELPKQDGKYQYVDKGHMFMKQAAFFSRSQVEKIA